MLDTIKQTGWDKVHTAWKHKNWQTGLHQGVRHLIKLWFWRRPRLALVGGFLHAFPGTFAQSELRAREALNVNRGLLSAPRRLHTGQERTPITLLTARMQHKDFTQKPKKCWAEILMTKSYWAMWRNLVQPPPGERVETSPKVYDEDPDKGSQRGGAHWQVWKKKKTLHRQRLEQRHQRRPQQNPFSGPGSASESFLPALIS